MCLEYGTRERKWQIWGWRSRKGPDCIDFIAQDKQWWFQVWWVTTGKRWVVMWCHLIYTLAAVCRIGSGGKNKNREAILAIQMIKTNKLRIHFWTTNWSIGYKEKGGIWDGYTTSDLNGWQGWLLRIIKT